MAHKTSYENQRSDASFVETVKLEISSAISSAIRDVAENAIRAGLSFEVVAQITGLSAESINCRCDEG